MRDAELANTLPPLRSCAEALSAAVEEPDDARAFLCGRRRGNDTAGGGGLPFRGGATLVVDVRTSDLRYIIHKRLYEDLPGPGLPDGNPATRFDRRQGFEEMQQTGAVGGRVRHAVPLPPDLHATLEWPGA